MLELNTITKIYGTGDAAHTALREVSVSIDRGEFNALMGPSGCGKSTLLHIAGAMDRATSGQVTLAGTTLDSLSESELARVRRTQVGFVFQAFNLLPTLTTLENVCLPLSLERIDDRTAKKKGATALELVGLDHKILSYPSQLSGGELQRVAIARAIAIEPDLLIADEPTGSLDSQNGERVLDLLAQLNQSLGLTILMATHSEEAASYAKRCLTMRDGQLETSANANAVTATL